MARDPQRIPDFLHELGLKWLKYSDLRFGQFVKNLSRDEQTGEFPGYLELGGR